MLESATVDGFRICVQPWEACSSIILLIYEAFEKREKNSMVGDSSSFVNVVCTSLLLGGATFDSLGFCVCRGKRAPA